MCGIAVVVAELADNNSAVGLIENMFVAYSIVVEAFAVAFAVADSIVAEVGRARVLSFELARRSR